jgi:S-layer protein
VTTSAGVSKAISLGAGDDKLTLASGTTALTANIDGGAGTDTLSMVAADAVTASANILFAGRVTGFEALTLTGGTGTQSVAVDVLGSYHAVTTGAAGGALTMSGFASGDTLTLTSNVGAGSYVVSGVGTAWATPTTDSFNIVLSSAASLTAGGVTADSVETLNITSTDTDLTSVNANTLSVAGSTATSIVLSGNSALTLTSTAALATTVNASAMTAGLTFTASGTAAQTVTGSATAANALTAKTGATTADVLIGGAGADVLTANAGSDVLTGGAGKDTFVVATASANANVYTTIADAASGDTLKLADKGTEIFTATKLSLADTASFQNYLDLAAAATATPATNGVISWFQFGGSTYVVEDMSNNATYTAGTDLVVKLTGLIDFSTASFNTGAGPTLLLA